MELRPFLRGRDGSTALPVPLNEADRLHRVYRLSSLRREVTAGRYRVPAEAVADAIIRFYRRAP